MKSSKSIASDRARRGPSVVGYGGSKSQPPSGDRDWRFGVERAYAMKLTFLGTRGEIEICTRRHRRHSSLLVQYRCPRHDRLRDRSWLGRLRMIAPTAVVLTQAHPDHASGLAEGAPVPGLRDQQDLGLAAALSHFRSTHAAAAQVRGDRRAEVQGVSGPSFNPSARCWISRVGGKPQLLRTCRTWPSRPLLRRHFAELTSTSATG